MTELTAASPQRGAWVARRLELAGNSNERAAPSLRNNSGLALASPLLLSQRMKKPESISIVDLTRCTGGLGGVQSSWHPEDFKPSSSPFSLIRPGTPFFALDERQYQTDRR
jgi:hypothetical protein